MENVEKSAAWALASNVKALRTKSGLSQRELSQRCGLSQSAIAEVELMKSNPTLDVLQRIAEQLSVPVSALLGGDRDVSNVIRAAAVAAAAFVPLLAPAAFIGACVGALGASQRPSWLAATLTKEMLEYLKDEKKQGNSATET